MVDSGNRVVPASKDRFDYDAELRHHHRRLREAIDVGPTDNILDIGCGTGQITREVARIAHQGSALGVDISPMMLAQARELSAAEELGNVRFEQADAQVHPFPAEHFTLAISRFGTMFFADPVEAFTNIGRALRPGAQLAQLVWQAGDRQEWVTAIRQAIAGAPVPAPVGGAFSLADPAEVENVLTAAGFTDVSCTEVNEPVYYGAEPDDGVDAVLALRMLADVDPDETERALDRLHVLMAAHCGTEGVWFDSRSWLVTARR